MTKQEVEELDSLLGIIPTKLSFFDFVNKVTAGRFKWYDYAQLLAEQLQQVADDQLYRLMIFMPPRHGKSELASRLFPAYYLYRHPERWAGLVSHTAALSYTFSRAARNNLQKGGTAVQKDAKAVSHWQTAAGGGLWATGIGGPLLGKGYHLGVIDDPIKNSTEAFSQVYRARNQDWLDSTFLTRQEPGAAIVFIMQRWAKNDLAAYLLEKEKEEPEHWHIVHFEAVKTSTVKSYPDTCTLVPDYREEGEALSPERYPKEKLDKLKKQVGWFWSGLYQQDPVNRKGLVYRQFNSLKHVLPEVPVDKGTLTYFYAFDFGATNEAFSLFAADLLGRFYLVHSEMLPQGTTASRAKIVKQHLAQKRIRKGWGGAASEDQQRKDYMAAGVAIGTPPVADYESTINLVNSLFENNKLYILSSCTEPIDHLSDCIRDENGEVADRNSWHILDTFRYFAAGVNVASLPARAATSEDRFK